MSNYCLRIDKFLVARVKGEFYLWKIIFLIKKKFIKLILLIFWQIRPPVQIFIIIIGILILDHHLQHILFSYPIDFLYNPKSFKPFIIFCFNLSKLIRFLINHISNDYYIDFNSGFATNGHLLLKFIWNSLY